MMGQHISKKRGDGCSARHENANNTVGLGVSKIFFGGENKNGHFLHFPDFPTYFLSTENVEIFIFFEGENKNARFGDFQASTLFPLTENVEIFIFG